MKYRMKTTENGFVVQENDTRQNIVFSVFADKCDEFIVKLNKGAGFAGKTPAFFCQNILDLD